MIQMADAGLESIHIGKRRQKQKMGGQAHNTSHQRAPGWNSLAIAVIEQAITDYFILVHAGVIRFGKVVGKVKGKINNRSNGRVYYSYVISGIPANEIELTIYFLRKDVVNWAQACELESKKWNDLFDAIIMREHSGKHYFHYNSERGKIENATT